MFGRQWKMSTKVITAGVLNAERMKRISKELIDARRANAAGKIFVKALGPASDLWMVRHDDGILAVYHDSELIEVKSDA